MSGRAIVCVLVALFAAVVVGADDKSFESM